MKNNIHLWLYLLRFFSEWEMFQTIVVEKIKTHILCSITFSENRPVCEIIWKSVVELGRPQMITQPLFMSSSSLTFSKAADLFVISIWYCFLTSRSFSFLRFLPHQTSVLFVFLLPIFPSLLPPPDSDQCHNPLLWNFVVYYARMPSPIHQYFINLVMNLPIRRSPGALTNVSVREHRTLNN